MDKQLELLKDLTDTNGIAGFESAVKQKVKNYLEPVSDEIIEDNLGGVYGKKHAKAGSKTILVAGHLDEIGFIITEIDDNGFLKFTPVGGWWNQVMLSQRMHITTGEGKVITGVIGSKPPHVLSPEERKKPVEIKDMFIDIGVASKEEVLEAGVMLGDMVTPASEFEEMTNKDYLLAKAWDNRYGVALSIDVMKNLEKENIDVNFVGGATVQEEVGLRGAKVAANKVNPDLAIAVDVGLAMDTPGMKSSNGTGDLGKGPLVLLMDGSMIGHVPFRKHVMAVAKDKDIPVQLQVITGGGTDAGAFHTAHDGVPSVVVGVPVRYMHSNVSIMHKEDYNNAVKLVTEVVKSLNDDKVDEIIW